VIEDQEEESGFASGKIFNDPESDLEDFY